MGKNQSRCAQVLVQLLAGDAGLDADIHVFGVEPDDFVHPHQVDAHPALERGHAAFQRRAGAEGDDRHVPGGAQLNDFGDLFGGLREHHQVGGMAVVIGFVVAVLLAHGLGRGQPVAQKVPQGVGQVVIDVLGLGHRGLSSVRC